MLDANEVIPLLLAEFLEMPILILVVPDKMLYDLNDMFKRSTKCPVIQPYRVAACGLLFLAHLDFFQHVVHKQFDDHV